MFSSHGARVVAFFALIHRSLNVMLGFSNLNGWMGLSTDDLGRYTPYATTGQVIDRGTYEFLAAMALGTLAEIGLALRK